MKPTIPPAVWEKKRSQIAKLYKDEEWPLKHVIKQIRTEDFNPSETQLRSRLKKWRVTKPSRQCRKKSQDSPPYRATDVDTPVRSATATPPSPADDTPTASATLPKTDSTSPPSDTNWSTFHQWYPAPGYTPSHELSSKGFDEHHGAQQWVFATAHPGPTRDNNCNNLDLYKYPNVQSLTPINTYAAQKSARSSISTTPIELSPPLCSPFTESAFPELCFSTLPPPEYEWPVQLGEDIKQTDIATTSGYTGTIEAIHMPAGHGNRENIPLGAEYTNYIHTPSKSDSLDYPDPPPFTDGFNSIEPLSEAESWHRAISGSLDNGSEEPAIEAVKSKRSHKPEKV